MISDAKKKFSLEVGRSNFMSAYAQDEIERFLKDKPELAAYLKCLQDRTVRATEATWCEDPDEKVLDRYERVAAEATGAAQALEDCVRRATETAFAIFTGDDARFLRDETRYYVGIDSE